jgi:membrane-anchored protein YejM (alkaline phosphatase superfamily)
MARMPTGHACRAAAVLLLLAACSRDAPRASPADAARLPDIVLVSIDSLRPDHLRCYGGENPTSPNIDALAAGGVRCEVALSTTSWTLPAHAALFTGLYDSTHGLVTNGLSLSPKATTLADCLQRRGYRTAGFFGGPYLHPAFGLSKGFETWESCMRPLTEELIEKGELGGESAHEDVTGPRTVAALAKFLERPDPRPLFLFVHLFDVHYDYNPPPEDVLPFDPDYTGTTDFSHLDRNPAISKDMPPRDRKHLLALYDGEIRFTDRNLAQILALLERQRSDRMRLLVVTADHGEEFFEHGNKGHQHSLYEELVRIPMIWNWPGHLPKDTLVRDPVRIVDIMPTLLSVAGVLNPPRMQGRNLWPLLTGQPLPEEPALLELLVDRNDVRALRQSESKVIDWRGPAGATYGFHLIRDRFESRPFGLDQDWVRKTSAELRRQLDANAELRARLGCEPVPLQLSRELDWRLHQFGYTEGKPK